MPAVSKKQEPARRRYAVGDASRERILEAAEKVLARDGYHAFSTRQVAQECSISSGNLTYYFPTKNSLIESLMEAIYDRYERRYTDPKNVEPQGAPDRLTRRMTQILEDALDAEATGLSFELWVMARHNAFAADLVGRLYERSARAIAEAMADEHPHLSSRALLRAAYLLLTLTDGVGSVFSQGGDHSVEPHEIIPLAVESVRALLESRSEDE